MARYKLFADPDKLCVVVAGKDGIDQILGVFTNRIDAEEYCGTVAGRYMNPRILRADLNPEVRPLLTLTYVMLDKDGLLIDTCEELVEEADNLVRADRGHVETSPFPKIGLYFVGSSFNGKSAAINAAKRVFINRNALLQR